MQSEPTSEAAQTQTCSRGIFWQRHVRQWRESGLSKAAYCQQHSLVYHQMVYWSSKATIQAENQKDTKVPSSGFIAVSVSPTLANSALSIQLPNGIAIEGIDERSVTLVGKLIEQL